VNQFCRRYVVSPRGGVRQDYDWFALYMDAVTEYDPHRACRQVEFSNKESSMAKVLIQRYEGDSHPSSSDSYVKNARKIEGASARSH
jgi:hypothetical protein